VAAAVGDAGEYLARGGPQLGPGGRLRVGDRVVVARSGYPGAFEQVGQRI
jgi:hypothetical protein